MNKVSILLQRSLEWDGEDGCPLLQATQQGPEGFSGVALALEEGVEVVGGRETLGLVPRWEEA